MFDSWRESYIFWWVCRYKYLTFDTMSFFFKKKDVGDRMIFFYGAPKQMNKPILEKPISNVEVKGNGQE